jgi:phosphate starvation-inducible PhoH-like protein
MKRPVVTVEEELGFLPGNIKNKMDPWTRPIFDIFLEYYHQREIDAMIQSGVIEISPLAFMRGRTFKRCFILADEMQNSSPNQMVMLTTRIGYGSKMVVNGDLRQSDLTRQNGLEMFLQKIRHFSEIGKNHTGIAVCSMKYTDVERSPVVSMVLEILDQSNISKPSKICNVEEKKEQEKENEILKPIYDSNTNSTNIVDGSNGFTDAALIPLNYYKKDFKLLNYYINKKFD